MKSKNLIYFSILLISLLAISSVHASEDINTINELTDDNVNDELGVSDEISDREDDGDEITTVKENLQSSNLEANNLQVKANDITIPTTEINITGTVGMRANITVNIIKNSSRTSKGNITYITKSPYFNGNSQYNFNYISLVEGDNPIVLNVPIFDGISEIKYKDANSTWNGTIKINLFKEATHFEASSKTIYKNNKDDSIRQSSAAKSITCPQAEAPVCGYRLPSLPPA